jgi:hypothetical protein
MAQLLSNLPIGAKVKFGKFLNADLIWFVADKSHTGYPANSVTLLAEKIIYNLVFDALESEKTDTGIEKRGNTHYGYSNLRQWLNSDAGVGQWYSPQHASDVSPSSSEVAAGVPYSAWAGFLNSFSQNERSAILDTTVTYTDDAGYLTSVDKIFIMGYGEFGTSQTIHGQVLLSLFETVASARKAKYTSAYRALNPTYSESKTGDYWLRDNASNISKLICSSEGESYIATLDTTKGVRPLTNVTPSLKVSDSTDSEGCYKVLWNTAPPAPTTLNAPTIYGGKSNPISWSSVTDPDGDAVTYQLECSVNGGAYTQIYSGASTSYAHLVPFGTTSVAYRVKATDPSGESSAYKTSATVTVINNNAPVISGTDSNLGVKSSGFTGTYTITDANNNAVTVTEAIDGVQIRSLVATLGQAITYGVTENTWLALPNGSHTLTIRATDGIDTSVRTYTFTKLVETLKIQNSTPWAASSMPTRIMLVITRNIPSAATFKVEVCNNGYDSSPTWEDCAAAVKSGMVHVFTNKSKTASKWGVIVRVTVNRNGATGACYVSAIGGNFE